MRVSNEMVDAALEVVRGYTNVPAHYVRDALEAAFGDLPEPDMQEAALRGCGNVIRALEAKLSKVQQFAFDSDRTMEERVDRIQDVLSGKMQLEEEGGRG